MSNPYDGKDGIYRRRSKQSQKDFEQEWVRLNPRVVQTEGSVECFNDIVNTVRQFTR